MRTRRHTKGDLKYVGDDNWDFRNGYMYPESPNQMVSMGTTSAETTASPSRLQFNRTNSGNESPVHQQRFSRTISQNVDRAAQAQNQFFSPAALPEPPQFHSTGINNEHRNINESNEPFYLDGGDDIDSDISLDTTL